MRSVTISSIVLLLALGASGNVVRGQSGAGRGAGAQAAPAAPKDKAAYFPNSDIQAV